VGHDREGAVPYVWMRDPYTDPNVPPVPWQSVGYFVPTDGKWESLFATSGLFDRVLIEPDPLCEPAPSTSP